MGLEALVSLEKIAVPGNMNFLNQLERIAEWGIPFSLMVVVVQLQSFFLPELLCRVGGLSGKVQQIALQALTSRYHQPSWGWTGLFGIRYSSYFASRQLTSKAVSISLPFFPSFTNVLHSTQYTVGSSTSKQKAGLLPSFLSFSFSRVRGTH